MVIRRIDKAALAEEQQRQQRQAQQQQQETARLLARAKLTLAQYLQMDEAQAHRYIEKQAMDLRQSKREIAESIIRMYEVPFSQER